jgi:hypothetical protein
MKKIKALFYTINVAFLTIPALAAAQFEAPTGTNLPESTLSDIVQNVMYWLLWLVGIVGVIGFAIAGLLYLTATGDETRIARAKSAMLFSIIGIIVALAGLIALNFAQGLLGGATKF